MILNLTTSVLGFRWGELNDEVVFPDESLKEKKIEEERI